MESIKTEADTTTLFFFSLKQWFVIHCILDLLFAIPMLLFPAKVIALLQWPYFDPLTTRLVAAALMGIGLESFLGRNAQLSHFRGMLRLKLIWSGTATIAIFMTLLATTNPPVTVYLLTVIFAGFHLVWWFWYRQING